MTSGIERSVLTYKAATIASRRLPDNRINARMVPSTMPPSIAMTVSWTEKISPLRIKPEATVQFRKAKSRFI